MNELSLTAVGPYVTQLPPTPEAVFSGALTFPGFLMSLFAGNTELLARGRFFGGTHGHYKYPGIFEWLRRAKPSHRYRQRRKTEC